MTVAQVRGVCVAGAALVAAGLREWLHAHCDEMATMSGLALAAIVPVASIAVAWLVGLATDPAKRTLVAVQSGVVAIGALAANGLEDYLRAHCEVGAQLGDVVQAIAVAVLALVAHRIGVKTPTQGPPA